MPFVRFSRDKRGYEYIYLIHAPLGNGGRGPASRLRVLYWYRTPPGVKVGREPFDPPLRAVLEAQNPDLVFDWKKILEAQAPPPPEAEPWRERRRAERSAKQAARSAPREEEPETAALDVADVADVPVQLDAAIAGDVHSGIVESGTQPDDEEEREDGGSDDAASIPNVAETAAAQTIPEGNQQPRGRRRRRGGRHRRREGDAAVSAVAGPEQPAGPSPETPDAPVPDSVAENPPDAARGDETSTPFRSS